MDIYKWNVKKTKSYTEHIIARVSDGGRGCFTYYKTYYKGLNDNIQKDTFNKDAFITYLEDRRVNKKIINEIKEVIVL